MWILGTVSFWGSTMKLCRTTKSLFLLKLCRQLLSFPCWCRRMNFAWLTSFSIQAQFFLSELAITANRERMALSVATCTCSFCPVLLNVLEIESCWASSQFQVYLAIDDRAGTTTMATHCEHSVPMHGYYAQLQILYLRSPHIILCLPVQWFASGRTCPGTQHLGIV